MTDDEVQARDVRAFLASEPEPGDADGFTAAVLARVRAEPERTAVDPPPVIPLRRHPAERHRLRPLTAAAVFVAAALGAALLVHTSRSGHDVAAADLQDRVLAAQHDVSSLSAHLTLVEQGWNPAVPERRFEGELRYQAPETLDLSLRDHTTYPTAEWRPDDVDLIVGPDEWSVTAPRDCPSPAQPSCTPTTLDQRVVTGRAPFSAAAPAPLDLVMPVQSFALAGTAPSLPDDDVDGRPTIGIRITAAQVGPLLDGLRPAGNLRRVYPTDPVELRLDRDTLVPLRVSVEAAPGADRRAWAAAAGYEDAPGDVVLDLTLSDVEVNGSATATTAPSTTTPTTGAGSTSVDEGFRDGAGPGAPPRLSYLPPGLRPYRSGVTDTAEGPAVTTRTWTDGRTWLSVSATAEWPGGRLFGDLGTVVRVLDLGAAGTGYLSEDGEAVGIHATHLDVVVTGSVSRDELLAVARGLAVDGRPVPPAWAESGATDLAAARDAVDPLLLPHGLDGFARPGLRVDGAVVTASFAGAGDRSFTLEQSTAAKLPPPTEADGVVPVTVRGLPGRYTVARGELEWFDGGHLYRLRSLSLSRAELLAIAGRLEPS